MHDGPRIVRCAQIKREESRRKIRVGRYSGPVWLTPTNKTSVGPPRINWNGRNLIVTDIRPRCGVELKTGLKPLYTISPHVCVEQR